MALCQLSICPIDHTSTQGFLFSLFSINSFIVSYLVDLCRMESTRIGQWLNLLVACVLLLLKADASYVPITYVQNAVAKGAGEEFLLCLILVNFTYFALHLMLIIFNNVYNNNWKIGI